MPGTNISIACNQNGLDSGDMVLLIDVNELASNYINE